MIGQAREGGQARRASKQRAAGVELPIGFRRDAQAHGGYCLAHTVHGDQRG